ncbi:MAG: ABC transporter permease [Lachnospiraceae bacterium]|nr:ABC transporter permease [Lachnospiraceae bacterium]
MKKKCIRSLPVITAAVLFLLIYGIQILNPLYDAWLYSGNDLTQHYLGYLLYKSSDWSFPIIGKTDRIFWPRGVSVTYTDSIPLVSFILKLFRQFLPDHFQLFGIFGFVSFCLMGYFAARLLRHTISNEWFVLIGSVFFVLAPVYLYRLFMHTALSSEWLILWGLCLGLDCMAARRDPKALRKRLVETLFLGFFASSIHIYLLVMVTLSVFSAMLLLFLRGSGIMQRLRILLWWILYLFVCVTTIYLFGAFYTNRDSLMAPGLGNYTFNLNGFFNPMGWSRFLPNLSYYGAGAVNYVGLGVLLLFAAAIVLGIIGALRGHHPDGALKEQKENQLDRMSFTFLFLTGIFSFLLSQSPVIAFDGTHYLTLSLPEWLTKAWSIVRDTERFIWTVIYILMFAAMTVFFHNIRQKRWAVLFLALLLAVQVTDISGPIEERHNRFTTRMEHTDYDDATLDALMETGRYAHISFTSNRTENLNLMYTMAEYSLHHDLTLNMFYVAHDARLNDAIDMVLEELENGPRDDTIYIFKEQGDGALMQTYASKLHYYAFDQGYVGVTQEISDLQEVKLSQISD